jgi:hypothetical protein
VRHLCCSYSRILITTATLLLSVQFALAQEDAAGIVRQSAEANKRFLLVGKRTLGGHHVFVLKATPRKDYKPPNRDCEALTGMEGTLWIDQKTFQWVKVEAHVIHPRKDRGVRGGSRTGHALRA